MSRAATRCQTGPSQSSGAPVIVVNETAWANEVAQFYADLQGVLEQQLHLAWPQSEDYCQGRMLTLTEQGPSALDEAEWETASVETLTRMALEARGS